VLKKMLTTGGLALVIADAVPLPAHAQVTQPNQQSAATTAPVGEGPAARNARRQPARRTLPNTASALPFIALGAVLAVVLGVMIRIGVNSID
jgi:hypothetical protein